MRNFGVSRLSSLKLEHAVFGNGKEGLTIVVDRIDNRLDGLEEKIDAIPSRIEALHAEVQSLSARLMDSKTVKTITREEIQRYKKEEVNAPGSWEEFRKSILFPIMLMVISSFVTAGLTYWAVAVLGERIP